MSNERALRDFVSGGGASFIALLLSTVFAFFTKIILARTLGPSGYGLYEMVLTILGFTAIISSLGFDAGLRRFIPLYNIKDSSYSSGIIRAALIIQFFTSIFVALLLLLFAGSIAAFFNFPEIFVKMLYLAAIALPFKKFSSIIGNIFLAHKKVLISKTGIDIIQKGVLLLGAVTIFLFDLSLIELTLFIIISYFAALIFYLFNLKHLAKKIKTKKPKYELKRWFNYSIPLIFVGLLAFFLRWTDNFVIGKLMTQEDLGIYAVAFGFAIHLFIGSKLFAGVFLPIMTEYYEKDRKQFKNLFITVRNWSILFSLLIGSVFILFADNIILFLFGQEYVAGASSLQVLSVFFIIANYFFFSIHLLHLEEQTKRILYGEVFTVILNLLLTIYLVMQIGILGAAIAAGFSYFLIRYYFHIQSKKYVRIGHDYVYMLKCFVATFGSALVSYVLTTFIFSIIPAHFIFYILTAGFFYLILLVMGIRYLSILKEQDILIIETTEKYTKINLDIVKRLLFRRK